MKTKLPTKANTCSPHQVVFLKKQLSAVTCNILGGCGRKRPCIFQLRYLFIQKLAAALRNQQRFTGTPAGNADDALRQQNAALHPEPWSREEAGT